MGIPAGVFRRLLSLEGGKVLQLLITQQLVLFDKLSTDYSFFFPEYKLSPRFSATLMNQSIALVITCVEERDLGLYYCIADVHRNLTVGSGTELQGKRFSAVVILLEQNTKFFVQVK